MGLVAIIGCFVALSAPFLPHTVDDAFITFRYSRQWGLGVGPYFNPGEHVEGYTNFLYMLLMTPVIRLGGPGAALPAAKAIGLVAAAAALAGSFFIARRLALAAKLTRSAADYAGLAAAGLVACTSGIAVNAVSGLETLLYAALVTWGLYGFATGTRRGTWLGGIALAAAAITRPEGALVFAAGWLLAVAQSRWPQERSEKGRDTAEPRRWRDLLVAGCIGLAVVGAHLIFRRVHYDGEWLPNTYYAKTSGWGDRNAYVVEGLGSPFLGMVGLLVALVGWLIEPRSARSCVVVGGAALFGSLLPLVVGADWMIGYRLIVPYVPALAAAVSVGWLRLAMRLVGPRPALGGILLWATIPASLLLQWPARESFVQYAALATRGTRTGHAALAEWLQEDAREGDSIALMDIGLIGYRCIHQTVLDLTGLTDRRIAKSPGAFLAKEFDPAYVLDKRPRYIVLAFVAPGDPYAPLAPGAALSHFSPMEARIAAHPDFRRFYVDTLRVPEAAPSGFESAAAAVGARGIFPYAIPNYHYLLAVYRRHD